LGGHILGGGEGMSIEVKVRQLSLDDFVAELHRFPEPAFRETGEILSFLQQTAVRPETLTPFLTWDRQHYTRNLVDKTPLYELIAICWETGQVSSVHNHRDQNCWMAVPVGRLMVENFHLVSQDLDHGKCELRPTETVEMNPSYPCAVDPGDPVHRVVNPKNFGERAVSLHIYSRPFDTCVVYSPEQGTCGVIKLQYTTVFGKPA
jgi:cysteine dioxygenase